MPSGQDTADPIGPDPIPDPIGGDPGERLRPGRATRATARRRVIRTMPRTAERG